MYKSIIILILISSLAFAETHIDAKFKLRPEKEEQAEKLATTLGVVYVGMPKAALYQVYTDLQQKGYRKDGRDEWITFTDWMSEEPGALITFYLRDSKVRGWKTKKPDEGSLPQSKGDV